MATSEVLAENKINSESLAGLFKRAFFSTSIDEDSDIIVQIDRLRVFVLVKKDLKLLKYMAVYGVKETSPVELKHALINKMNADVVFGRFSISASRSDRLIADYFLPYEEGIPAFLIISALRLFAKVVPDTIRSCDDNDLVD